MPQQAAEYGLSLSNQREVKEMEEHKLTHHKQHELNRHSEEEQQRPEHHASEHQAHSQEVKGKRDLEFIAQLVIIGVLGILLVFNMVKLYGDGSADTIGTSTGILSTQAGIDVTPKGIPAIYGKELKISYDDISAANSAKADATIGVMGQYDKSINLQGEDLKRYIAIASQISCEYCCGAQSIIFSNGQAACGCAHSFAMRGLAKYLIKNHGAEFTDDQILEELGKWKVLFFPEIHQTKAAVLKQQGVELSYINLASNKYRGAEKGQTASGGMVGGC